MQSGEGGNHVMCMRGSLLSISVVGGQVLMICKS